MYVSFEKWCEDNNLVPLDLGDNVYQFGDKKYLLIQEKDGLMFDGDPASPEAVESILSAMQIGMEMAKKKNKEKYTPKKYKKD